MCGVEGAEYGFTADIRVARDDYYRCAVSLPDAPGAGAAPGGRAGCAAAIFAGAARPSGCLPVAAGAAENLLT
jgi:hypothetical protein